MKSSWAQRGRLVVRGASGRRVGGDQSSLPSGAHGEDTSVSVSSLFKTWILGPRPPGILLQGVGWVCEPEHLYLCRGCTESEGVTDTLRGRGPGLCTLL